MVSVKDYGHLLRDSV